MPIEEELKILHNTHPNLRLPSVYHIRDILAYGLILQEIEQSKGNPPIIPMEKWLKAISSSDMADLEKAIDRIILFGYLRQDNIADFNQQTYSLTPEAIEEIRTSFNSDLHNYKIDANLPGVFISGREFSRRINNNFEEKELDYDNLAKIIADSLKSLLPQIEISSLPSPHKDVSCVRLSYPDVWESGIVAIRNYGTLAANDFFQAAFYTHKWQYPHLMLYPSIDRSNASDTNTHSYIYGMSGLGTIRFLHLLSNLIQEFPAQKAHFSQHFPAFFDLNDYNDPNNDKDRVKNKYEYSPGHGIQMLKKTLN